MVKLSGELRLESAEGSQHRLLEVVTLQGSGLIEDCSEVTQVDTLSVAPFSTRPEIHDPDHEREERSS
jgi:hypothetical protein